MSKWLAVMLLLAVPSIASAQNQGQIVPSGSFTPGHTVRCQNSTCTVATDAGGSAGSSRNGQGYLTELGVTNTGTPVCINDALTSAPGGYHQLCFGANTLGGGLISYNAYGGAAPLPLACDINGVSGPCVASVGGLNILASNTVLQATPTTFATFVVRGAFTSAGDAPPITYYASGSPCSLNGGNGDNGSQVRGSNGNCWIAVFPSAGVSAMEFGAAGNGSTDDTAALQAASNAVALAGVPLLFDSNHLYSISSTINIANPVKWSGLFRYGVWAVNQQSGSTPEFCPWGVVNKTGTSFDMVKGTALTGTIEGVCFDATGSSSLQATSGAIIRIAPPTSITFSAGWHIEHNTLINGFDGVDADGSGGNGSGPCCGAGAGMTDPGVISNNTFTNNLGWAIALGRNTSGGQTSNITVYNNIVVCGAHGMPRGYGMIIADGSITVDATQNGPVGCQIGLALEPGTLNGHGQGVNVNAKGQLGSFSIQHDILIQPTGAGAVEFANFESQVFAGNGFLTGAPEPIRIDCSGVTSDGGCQEIAFTGLQGAVGVGATSVFHIVAGPFGPSSLSITGSSLCHGSGDHVSGASALLIDLTQGPIPVGVGPPGHFVFTGNRFGQGCEGIGMDNAITLNILGPSTAPYGEIAIVGNDLSGATTALNYTPTSAGTDHVVVKDNVGIDTEATMITSGSTITLPAQFNLSDITGTSAVSTIQGAWINRTFTLVPASSGLVFNTGGNICNSVTTVAGVPILLLWNFGFGCWNLK